jgi:hypothetical protein
MKKNFAIVVLISSILTAGCGCKSVAYLLTKGDAEAAIRQMLNIGAEGNTLISKDQLMQAILPGNTAEILQKVQQLGLSSEVDKFTNTLTSAANETASQSIPIFAMGIKKMDIGDAIGIVKNGGTAGTDFFRRTVGDTLRRAVRPVMKTALDKYNITREWDKLVAPARLLMGNRLNLNLDIDNLLAGVVTNAMFSKIADREREIRSRSEARTTPLLQRVFGRDWNQVLR